MRADPSAISFPILGRSFRVSNAPPALADWLRTSWHYPEHQLAPHPYRIEMESVSGAPSAPTPGWTPRDVEVPDRSLRFRTSGNVWEMGDARAGVRAQFDDGAARIEVWGFQNGEELSGGPCLGLAVVVSEALRASGLLPLHAAVAARGDAAVAWLGESGTGKSLTLLFAHRAGWRAVAEDLCWLEPEGLGVYGWDRGIRAWPDALRRFFPELSDAAAMADGKRGISYQRLGVDRVRSGTLAAIALLGPPADGPSRWEPATSREAVRALWEATGVPLLDRSQDSAARCVARLVRALPAARLVRGDSDLPLGDGGLGAIGLR